MGLLCKQGGNSRGDVTSRNTFQETEEVGTTPRKIRVKGHYQIAAAAAAAAAGFEGPTMEFLQNVTGPSPFNFPRYSPHYPPAPSPPTFLLLSDGNCYVQNNAAGAGAGADGNTNTEDTPPIHAIKASWMASCCCCCCLLL